MSVEDNKAVVHNFIEEVWHEGNLDSIPKYIASGYIRHTNHMRDGGREVRGLDGARQSIAALRTSFPDIHFTSEDVLVDEDKVVVRWTASGTHRGEFMGLSPTGIHVSWAGINIYRVADGKIVERWAYEDGVSLYQQLGLISAARQTTV